MQKDTTEKVLSKLTKVNIIVKFTGVVCKVINIKYRVCIIWAVFTLDNRI